MKYFNIIIALESNHSVQKQMTVEVPSHFTLDVVLHGFSIHIKEGHVVGAIELDNQPSSFINYFAALQQASELDLTPKMVKKVKRTRTKDIEVALRAFVNGADTISRDGNRFIITRTLLVPEE